MTNQKIENAWNNLTKSAIEFGKISISEFIDDIQANTTNVIKKEIKTRQNTSASTEEEITKSVAKNPQAQLTPEEIKQNLANLKKSGQELFDMIKKTVNKSLSIN